MTGLERFRRKQLLSRADLADYMGVSVTAVFKWENRKSVPTTKNLLRLSTLYGVSINDLLRNDYPANDLPAPLPETKEAI